MPRSGAHLETEIKLRVPSAAAATERLTAAGFVIVRPRVFESNIILDTADAALRSRGCLLRIRRSGEELWLTFKGPATSERHKSREEIETSVSDWQGTLAIFSNIGYREAFVYEKYRTEFGWPNDERGLVMVDETPVGVFLEIEGERDWIEAAAGRLGYSVEEYITSSYARIYEEHCNAKGESVTNMVFAERNARE